MKDLEMYYEYLEMRAHVTQFNCIKSMLQPTINNAHLQEWPLIMLSGNLIFLWQRKVQSRL